MAVKVVLYWTTQVIHKLLMISSAAEVDAIAVNTMTLLSLIEDRISPILSNCLRKSTLHKEKTMIHTLIILL